MNEALHEWIERLRTVEMPVFGAVAQEVARLTKQKDVPTSTLANVILQDPSMTAKVLRVSNGAYYPKLSQITTVSRAITLLGFEVVGRVCLSVALVESLLRERPKQGLLKVLAQSLYAAVLARTMAEKRRDESPEEVFIAALLYRLGSMAFWCYGGRTAETLSAILDEPDVDERRAEHMLLGFELPDLTLALAREWNLGDLLVMALSLNEEEGARSRGISLAHELALLFANSDQGGERKHVIRMLARHSKVPVESMEELVRESSELAAEFARNIGADLAISEIPGQKGIAVLSGERPPDAVLADAQLQLRILRELVMTASGEADPDTLIQLALEGLYRGVGLDRVVFLSPTPDEKELRAKFALAAEQTGLLLSFAVSLTSGNLFSDACRDDQSVWAPILPENERILFSEPVQKILQKGPFLLAPIRARGKLYGVLYADRLPSGRPLDRESSESFELFCFQIRQIFATLR